MKTQTIIAKSYASQTLTASIHNRLTDADLAPGHTIEVTEINAGGGIYSVVLTHATDLIEAITGRLKLFSGGSLIDNDQLFTFAGTDGETVDTGAAVLDSADQTEVLDAVTAANAKLDSIALKTALINAGRLRVLSRVVGNVINAHAGDDHLILAENALTLEVDDDDASLYALLTDATNQSVYFGAGRSTDIEADAISAIITADSIRHEGTSTFLDIELPAAATAGRRGEYDFDIQITNSDGYKITPQALQGTLFVEVDRKS